MVLISNRKASHDYEILDKYVAGIILKGYEVKALREGNAKLDGSYVRIEKDGVYVTGMHIGEYSKQSQESEDPDRPRKLLLNEREIENIQRDLREKGKTAVPLAVLLENNLIKLEFAVVRGKKKASKKQAEKQRQIEKDERSML
jgi:SsrA-binding protein